MLPISKMPATHPSVTHPGDGTALKAGDPIPTSSCARYQLGAQPGCGAGLFEQTAPQLFYAYGYPKKNTGNPGYYAADAASLYPIVDAESNVYLVMTLDEPGKENDLTEFAMHVSSSGIPAGTVKVALMDDLTEKCLDATVCKKNQKNTVAWDETSAAGTFYWKWVASAGDGMALGPLPLAGWTMTFKSLKVEGDGMTKLLVGGYVPSRNEVTFDEISMAEFTAGVTLSGKSSTAACAERSAGECVTAPCCSLCRVEYDNGEVAEACAPASHAEACNGIVYLPGSCLPECNALNDDHMACMAADGCGYCDATKRCLTGRPGVACEPCEEPLSGNADPQKAWPHEGRGVKWVAPVKLTAYDGERYEHFGTSVAISATHVVVGAYRDDDIDLGAGSAYIYERDGAFVAKLYAPDGGSGANFGQSLAITDTHIVVGAPGASSAYIYERDGAFVAKLTAPDPPSGSFGQAVAISATHVVVGAMMDEYKGSAYVYERDGAFVAKLTAPDGAFYDVFGTSVAISATHVVVGASQDDDKELNSGSAYIYECDGAFVAKLTATDASANGRFGTSVAISDTHIVVSATKGRISGSAYIYERDGAFVAKLTAPDAIRYNYFGQSVAISDTHIVVGAYGDDDKGLYSGSAYVYERDGAFVEKLTASDGAPNDYFGKVVAISGTYVVVGAEEDDDKADGSGSAYIYVV